jgi:hypothetical protein
MQANAPPRGNYVISPQHGMAYSIKGTFLLLLDEFSFPDGAEAVPPDVPARAGDEDNVQPHVARVLNKRQDLVSRWPISCRAQLSWHGSEMTMMPLCRCAVARPGFHPRAYPIQGTSPSDRFLS